MLYRSHAPFAPKPGSFAPLGASFDGKGTNFALFSVPATAVDLCLFDSHGLEERVPLTEVDSFIWYIYLPDIGPGQRYGYRIHGPWDLAQGLRCNPNKLLLDPYSLAIEGQPNWGADGNSTDLLDYDPVTFQLNPADSAGCMPRSIVVDQAFDWSGEKRPSRSEADTIIYECHVKGMTMLNPSVPMDQRGTYQGLVHPSVLKHLSQLGVTAIELMPVQQFINDREVARKGAIQYWGHMPIGYFAPHNEYTAATGRRGEQVNEFKHMVKTFHNAGFEVILDVVFNHTGEGASNDGSLCFRGIDNRTYYLLHDDDPSKYSNLSGCGNTLNIWNPTALRFVMDALRYWVTDMHVDGFRFDLAGALAETDAHRSISVFLDLVGQEPLLNTLKLIAEPWFMQDNTVTPPILPPIFPPRWSQWNDQSRDSTRDMWRSIEDVRRTFFYAFTGSPNRFSSRDGYQPTASVNYVASHDGLTLQDLVSYTDDNQRSWNCGEEGPTRNASILQLRARQARNMLATIFLCQGMPMLLHGDECGRTQNGNANAYDQDSTLSWLDWRAFDTERLAFTQRLLQMRNDHPVFRQRRFFQQLSPESGNLHNLAWFDPNGTSMTTAAWNENETVTVAVYLNGEGIPYPDPNGNKILDDSFLILFNAFWNSVSFTIPADLSGPWISELDTANPEGKPHLQTFRSGDPMNRPERSMLVLRRNLTSRLTQ